MRGRASSNYRHSSRSDCRRASVTGADVKKIESVREIGPGDHLLDAVENDRPRGIEQHLVLIGVELAHADTAAARQPAKRVRKPGSQARDVVECQHVTVMSCDEHLPLFPRQGPDRGGVRVDKSLAASSIGRSWPTPVRLKWRTADKGRSVGTLPRAT